MKQGDSGAEVRYLQDLLREAGYLDSPATGYFGANTNRAVRAFQADYGLRVDGIAGVKTIATLESVVGFRPVEPGGNVLRHGSTGAEVQALQTALRNQGYYFGTIDGVFGTDTEHAVKNYQYDRFLVTDGAVGSSTKRVLGLI